MSEQLDILSSQSLSDEEAMFNEIKAILERNSYNSSQVELEYRTPEKSESYYAINFFGRTCIKIIGKKSKYIYIIPAMTSIFGDFIELKFLKNQTWGRFYADDANWSVLKPALIEMYEYCLINSSDGFDCCSQYEKCSDNKNCVVEDKMFSGGCRYRQKLRKGIIFYGENRNI